MDQPTVMLLCGDLFFSTQLRSAAEQAGWRPAVQLSAQTAASVANTGDVQAIVVDLELSGLDIGEFVRALGETDRPPVIAFGPHVQERRLRAAAEAGCDQVLSRGQISSSLGRILEEIGQDP